MGANYAAEDMFRKKHGRRPITDEERIEAEELWEAKMRNIDANTPTAVKAFSKISLVLFGVFAVVTGFALCLTIIGAILGIPLIIFGMAALIAAKRPVSVHGETEKNKNEK